MSCVIFINKLVYIRECSDLKCLFLQPFNIGTAANKYAQWERVCCDVRKRLSTSKNQRKLLLFPDSRGKINVKKQQPPRTHQPIISIKIQHQHNAGVSNSNFGIIRL